MREQNITDKMFWDLEEGDFENMLEVKEFGTRKKLMKRIKEIKAEFTLVKEKEDRHAKRLSTLEKEGIETLTKYIANKGDAESPLLV